MIHYRVVFSEDGNTITFVSDIVQSEPRFRITYLKGSDGTVTIRFEIAPPGRPDEFSLYTEGTVRRK